MREGGGGLVIFFPSLVFSLFLFLDAPFGYLCLTDCRLSWWSAFFLSSHALPVIPVMRHIYPVVCLIIRLLTAKKKIQGKEKNIQCREVFFRFVVFFVFLFFPAKLFLFSSFFLSALLVFFFMRFSSCLVVVSGCDLSVFILLAKRCSYNKQWSMDVLLRLFLSPPFLPSCLPACSVSWRKLWRGFVCVVLCGVSFLSCVFLFFSFLFFSGGVIFLFSGPLRL